MRILSIGVSGINDSSDSSILDANVFQDYDAVIVNPESLDRLLGYSRISYSNHDKNILTSESGQNLSALYYKRSEEVAGLLMLGGVVVSFMQPLLFYTYKYYYQSREISTHVTNYDWLPKIVLKNPEIIKFGKGQTIEFIDSSHAFSEYIYTKPFWSAYIDKEDWKDWRILASAYDTHALAVSKRIGLGHFVLLPSYYDYHNGEILQRCIVKLIGDKETTIQPGWAKTLFVPGQEELNSKINEISDKIDDLSQRKAEFVEKRDDLERWKKLLYEKGKQQLEPVVREALTLLGCNVETQPDQDSDGLVTCEFGTALLEVVGSKTTIKIEKFGELTKNIGNFVSEKATPVGGILVGNPFCEESLENRPPKDSQKELFSKELVTSAEKQGIPVILTTDLYHIVCKILTCELNEADKLSIQERIFNGKGLVRLK